MQDQPTNSKDLLKQLLAEHQQGDFNDQKMYEMKREIEQKMERFDLSEREKTAQVANELSKIVITA